MMKKYITKANYPFWLVGIGFVCAILFLVTLDFTPGAFAFWLQILLFLGDGGLMVGSAVLIIRAIRGMIGWVKASVDKKQSRSRILGMSAGLLFAAPFVFYWFVTLSLAFGFLSIAIQQRQMYH